MIELPFASFFLSKMLGQHTINLDIDHLQSLDTELYRNLLYLKVSEIKIGRSIETDFYHVMFSTLVEPRYLLCPDELTKHYQDMSLDWREDNKSIQYLLTYLHRCFWNRPPSFCVVTVFFNENLGLQWKYLYISQITVICYPNFWPN